MNKYESNDSNDCTEVRIALEELNDNSQSFQISLNYSYGILSFYTNSFASIKPSFFNFKLGEKKEYSHSDMVIFAPLDASIVGVDGKIKTAENLYLVRYMDGGHTVNPKTGETQPTIDNAVPVAILMACSKKQCEYLYVEDGFVVWKMYPQPASKKSVPEPTEKINAEVVNVLDETAVTALADFLMTDIHLRGFSYSSKLPDYLDRICGTKDISKYAANVKGFVEKYLSASFKYEPHYTYEGKQIPGVILPQNPIEYHKQSKPTPPEGPTAEFYASDAEELDRTYDSGQYVEYLSANCFQRLSPEIIPIKYLEKAITAARRLIFGQTEAEVELNHFQKCLLQDRTNESYSTWYSDTEYDNSIMEQCGSTMLPHFEKQSIPKILNDLIHTTSSAGRYLPSAKKKTMGVVSRLQIAKNEQTVPMYVVAAFAQNNPSSLATLIVMLCEFFKNYYSSISPSSQPTNDIKTVINLADVLRVILKAPYAKELTLTRNNKTLLLSTFIETCTLNSLDDDLAEMLFEDGAIQLDLIDLIRHHEAWSKERFVDLVNALNPHLQILERAVAMIWGDLDLQYDKDDHEVQLLPASLLKILAWLITYSDSATLEGVIDFPSIHGSLKYKRRTKCVSLLRALPEIQHLATTDRSIYNLGAYLSGKVFQEFEEYNIDEITTINITQFVSDWKRFAKNHFSTVLTGLESPSINHKNLYATLFRDFWQDNERETLLQQKYTAELLNDGNAFASPENAETILRECYSIKAFDAFVELYQQFVGDANVDFTGDLFKYYVSACNQIFKHQELIGFLLKHPEIEKEKQENYLIDVINASFVANQYSPAAFSIFNSGFSVENAIELLLTHFAKTEFENITSLIALYLYRGEFFKARYLYDIYSARARIGHTRIYAQFSKSLDSNTNHVLQVGQELNHLQVINTAFYALTPQDLIAFLSWAGTIPLPAWKDYNPRHNYKLIFAKLLEQPQNKDNWQIFLSQLSSRLSKFPANAWMVCVCDGVLSSKWNLTNMYDVHRAYKMVLTQILNPQTKRRYFPVNLLPYITSYIVRKDDITLCESLLHVAAEEQLWSRITTHNVWGKTYKENLAEFSQYCIRKLKETNNKVFTDILKIVSPSITTESLAAVAAIPGNEEYLIRQISKCYLNGNQLSEAQLLVKQINRSSLTFKATEALSILQFAYTDETELLDKYPTLDSEEKVFRLKQDCVKLLQNYPSDEDFQIFEKSDADPQYKRLVFSIAFGVFYNDDTFDRFSYDFKAFQRKTGQTVISMFLDKAFRSQLVYNKSYEFFYIRWRYLKLYAASVIASEEPVDPTDLIDLMKQHHHEETALDQYLIPFKNAVDAYWQDTKVEVAEKKNFLYSLIVGKFTDFFAEHLDSFSKFAPDTIQLMRAIVSALNYREVAASIYREFFGEIRSGQYCNALSVANALVPTAFDAVCALQQFQNDHSAWSFFEDSLSSSSGKCVNMLVTMNAEDYARCHDLVNPLVCSRQFPFQMYKIIRSILVQRKGQGFLERSGTLITYLTEHCDTSAPDVFHYLKALEAAINGNQVETANCLQTFAGRIESIPASWQAEASALQEYAAGSTNVFFANSSNLDASIEGLNANNTFFFGETLLKSMGAQGCKLTERETDELWDRFLLERGVLPEKEALVAGATVLCNYKVKNFDNDSKLKKLKEIANEVGILAIRSKSVAALIPDVKVDVASELISHNLAGQNLYSLFDALLKESGCSIRCWCRNRSSIRKFISSSGYYSRNFSDDVFAHLYSDILEPCSNKLELLDEQQYSLEELRKDLVSFKGIIDKMPTAPICKSLYAAIGAKIVDIENSVRMEVKIENPDNVTTDGFIYFNIKNIGKYAVALDQCELEFQQQTIQLGDSIKTLLPGYETGSKARYTYVPGEPVLVQLRNAGIVLSRDSRDGDTIQCKEPEPGIDLAGDEYDVKQAVRVFGREAELKKLNRFISKRGKALIYGPSRIGKTSILDGLRNPHEIARSSDDLTKPEAKQLEALNRDNLIIVTFGGEGTGKYTDYERIPEEASPETIEDHLLIQSILKALEDHDRTILPKAYSSEIEAGIRSCVTRCGTITSRYSRLGDYLREHGLEMWLILDEFQKIVGRWTPSRTGEFAEIWNKLNENSRIKLILCGSDDLLKHMVLKRTSLWRELMDPKYYGVQIQALKEPPFREMIEAEPLSLSGETVKDFGISYSVEALHALYLYTGGVPLYGKQICNQIMRTLEADEVFDHRNVIYSADVAQATQYLIDLQGKKSGEIKAIYDSVTKNLDETDEWVLSYIAKYIDQKRMIGCPYSMFVNNPDGALRIGTVGEDPIKALDDSLDIAEARGIIRRLEAKENEFDASDPVFTFCTVFYYNAFLGNARNDQHLERRLFRQVDRERDSEESLDFSRQYVVKQIQAHCIDSVGQYGFVREVIERLDPDGRHLRPMLEKDFSKTRQEFHNEGGSTLVGNYNTLNNITIQQVQINQISESVSGLLKILSSSSSALSAAQRSNVEELLERMPHLSLLPVGNETGEELGVDDGLANYDVDSYAETVERGVAASNESGQSLLDWAKENIDQLPLSEDALGFICDIRENSDTSSHKFRQADRDRVLTSLYLWDIYKQIEERTSPPAKDSSQKKQFYLDYSPVTILLGKTLEQMLIEKHLPIYQNPNVWKNKVCLNCNALKAPANKPLQFSRPMIGTFTTALHILFDIPEGDPEENQKQENKRRFLQRTNANESEWSTYYRELDSARITRDNSAHLRPVSKSECDALFKILFDQELLKRTYEYVKVAGSGC